ncbi:hypothetical protein HNR42_002587 [Deinobacterium chartae]|uniref:Uncharacterized protein n=1 Tax=Deinobacterium chartae TaxID=521158 RepID=A0A841I040_9DEIO|nr:hypothetical protein [Deinobacterium chartae]
MTRLRYGSLALGTVLFLGVLGMPARADNPGVPPGIGNHVAACQALKQKLGGNEPSDGVVGAAVSACKRAGYYGR